MRIYLLPRLLMVSLLTLLSLKLGVRASESFNVTGYDVGPDWSTHEHYPTLMDEHGNQIDALNIRGTRLFGYEGCGTKEKNAINIAFRDFRRMIDRPSLYIDIAWEEQAAKEFWGTTGGRAPIQDEQKEQIKQIYVAARELWSTPFTVEPPWIPYLGRQLWIHVRCSGGDGTGDPEDFCGDAPDQPQPPPECPAPPNQPPPPGKKSDMEAYSENSTPYSTTTFCNRFFSIRSLEEAETYALSRSEEEQNNLENWDSQARVFFHELTHLNYFMNAPGTSPSVDDLTIQWKEGGIKNENAAYGPYLTKVLRNWFSDGTFTQRNADSFAWYGVAMWVKDMIGRYPPLPKVGTKKPLRKPRNSAGNPLLFGEETPQDPGDIEGNEEFDEARVEGFTIPGCPDVDPPGVQSPPPPVVNLTCIDEASSVPHTVFSSEKNKVYSNFCNVANSNRNTLQWYFDVFGNLRTPQTFRPKSKRGHDSYNRRDDPDDPTQYSNWMFKLDWVPDEGYDPTNGQACIIECPIAFDLMASSACGAKGDAQNLMSTATQLWNGCGMYGYSITALRP